MFVKALAQAILSHPYDYEWTIQGFGMLRMYPTKDREFRLNVWDARFRYPDASLVHDHPWHFDSMILAGRVEQFRFEYVEESEATDKFLRQMIVTGEGGGLLEQKPEIAYMKRSDREIYREGEIYHQDAEEVHISLPVNGTVTINKRTMVDEESYAFVFWPYGTEWVTSEPRTATKDEIAGITNYSLMRWFDAN